MFTLGTSAPVSLHFRWEGPGSDLTLCLQDSYVTAMANLKTFLQDEDYEETGLNDFSDLSCKLILKSELLHSTLLELGNFGEDSLGFEISDSDPIVKLTAQGSRGRAVFSIFKTSDIVESHPPQTLERLHVKEEYRYQHVIKCLKTLSISGKTCIKIGCNGHLSLQSLISTPDSKTNIFVEFLVSMICSVTRL